jgi:hypothetical protein
MAPGTRNSGHSAQSLPLVVTNDLSAQAKAMLKRLTRHRVAAPPLIERWATAAECEWLSKCATRRRRILATRHGWLA